VTLTIISLEVRLFGAGQSVFGLLSIVTLFLAITQAYFWLAIKSLKQNYETALQEISNFRDCVDGKTNLSYIEDIEADFDEHFEEKIALQDFTNHKKVGKEGTQILDCSKL
jgi:hypothetical protein